MSRQFYSNPLGVAGDTGSVFSNLYGSLPHFGMALQCSLHDLAGQFLNQKPTGAVDNLTDDLRQAPIIKGITQLIGARRRLLVDYNGEVDLKTSTVTSFFLIDPVKTGDLDISNEDSQDAAFSFLRQQLLYFLPLPQGHGSFLPTLGSSRWKVWSSSSAVSPSPPLGPRLSTIRSGT